MKKRSLLVSMIMIVLPVSGVYGQDIVKKEIIINAPMVQVNQNTTKQVFYEDLDGDNKVEKIVILASSVDEYGMIEVTIKVNDRVMQVPESWIGGMPTAHVIDLDINDSKKELVIGGDACSSDYLTYFYGYEKGKLVPIGITEGIVEKVQLDQVYQMYIPGNGTVKTYERGKTLDTWYRDAVYTLNNEGKLIEKKVSYYIRDRQVGLLMPMTVYEKPDLASRAVRCFEAGTIGKIVLTDDESWCLFRADDGEEGWFNIKNWEDVGGTGKAAWEVFDGLFWAD